MTYDDITNLPHYKKIINMGLQDTTGPIQKKRLSIEFTKPAGVGREKEVVKYVAYANGSVRKGKANRYDPSNFKLNPITTHEGGLNTLEDYDKAFADIMMNLEGIRRTPDKVRRTDTDKIEYIAELAPKIIIKQIMDEGLIWRNAKLEQKRNPGLSIISALYKSFRQSKSYLSRL